jgi:hypothetical protein
MKFIKKLIFIDAKSQAHFLEDVDPIEFIRSLLSNKLIQDSKRLLEMLADKNLIEFEKSDIELVMKVNNAS